MKNLIALLALVAMIGVVAAQDLDAPKTGTAQAQQQQNQGGNGSLFDQLMAKLAQQQAEIEANHVTAWAFDSRYGWIWLSGRDHYGWQGFYGGEAGYSEFDYARTNLSPAEYAAFSAEAERVWWALEAQGLN